MRPTPFSWHRNWGMDSTYLSHSGPVLENGPDRPENRHGRYGCLRPSCSQHVFVSFGGVRIEKWAFEGKYEDSIWREAKKRKNARFIFAPFLAWNLLKSDTQTLENVVLGKFHQNSRRIIWYSMTSLAEKSGECRAVVRKIVGADVHDSRDSRLKWCTSKTWSLMWRSKTDFWLLWYSWPYDRKRRWPWPRSTPKRLVTHMVMGTRTLWNPLKGGSRQCTCAAQVPSQTQFLKLQIDPKIIKIYKCLSVLRNRGPNAGGWEAHKNENRNPC